MVNQSSALPGTTLLRFARHRLRNTTIAALAVALIVLRIGGVFDTAKISPPATAATNHAFQASVRLTLDPATHWQPRQGRVKFTLDDLTGSINLTDADASVNFRWDTLSASGAWVHSPNVRVVEATNPHSLTLAATIPELPAAPNRRVLGLGANTDGVGTFLGIVPRAEMWIVVKKRGATAADPVILDEVLAIGVTNSSVAMITAVAAIVVLIQFLRLFRPAGLTGSNVILQLIETRGRHASLSQFQIVLWTLLIGGAAVYVIALSGNLIPITEGALVLLGISGATTLGSRLAKERSPHRPGPRARRPGWHDLIACDGQIDVTRMQMLFFTVLVAGFVLIHVIDNYEIPAIPESFLALMGISNGVYVLNKFVGGSDDNPAAAGVPNV